MDYFGEGSADAILTLSRAGELLDAMLSKLGALRRVLLVPPDITRKHSWAGELACLLYARLAGQADVRLLPALGTHAPMTGDELDAMFPGIPQDRFLVHDWRNGIHKLGDVPGDYLRQLSKGKVHYSVPIYVSRWLVDQAWDRIISIGQLVPHEVIGIANHNKNIYIGVGGGDTIHRSHFLGAVVGMESIMGRADTPVRAVLDYADREFGRALPISYVLTVRSKHAGQLVTRGLFAGDDAGCFRAGAELSRQVNINYLERPIRKAVVFLEPEEFKSTWLGNKAVYRTRMALADAGELVVLAPGVKEFGEDPVIDRLIRKYGYRGTPTTLANVRDHADLAANLSAAAHLIHGSSEGRFKITYCPGKVTRQEIEQAGYAHADLSTMLKRYDPTRLADGFNTLPDGEEIFFVSNPGLGLWGLKERFAEQ